MKPLLSLVSLLALAGGPAVFAAQTNAPSASTNAPAGPKDYRAMLQRVRLKQQERNGLEEVQKAISAYQLRVGRLPGELGELVERGLLPDMPVAPLGARYGYDRTTGNVRLVPIGGKATAQTNMPGSANLVMPR